MENIQKKILLLKKRTQQIGENNKAIYLAVKKILWQKINNIEAASKNIENIFYKNGKLFIKTNNKALASEIFLIKNEIVNKLGRKKGIREIIVS